MAKDDILLEFRQTELLLRVLEGYFRMSEAVVAVLRKIRFVMVMPVIKVVLLNPILMQQFK